MDYENVDRPAKVTDTPALGITLQYPLDNTGRTLVCQTFVASDCTTKELNDSLDKVRKASDRQRAIVNLPTLRGLLSDSEDKLKAAVAAHYEAETTIDQLHNKWEKEHRASERRGELKLSSAQVAEEGKYKQQLGGSKSAIRQLQEAIEIDKRNIANAEKLIADGE